MRTAPTQPSRAAWNSVSRPPASRSSSRRQVETSGGVASREFGGELVVCGTTDLAAVWGCLFC